MSGFPKQFFSVLFIECFKGIKWSGNEREGPLLGYFYNGGELPVYFQQELCWDLCCSKFVILKLVVRSYELVIIKIG